MAQGLGDRFYAWLKSTGVGRFFINIENRIQQNTGFDLGGLVVKWLNQFDTMNTMRHEFSQIKNCDDLQNFLAKYPGYAPQDVNRLAVKLGCERVVQDNANKLIYNVLGDNPSEKVANILRGIGADPSLREILQVIGATVYDSVIGMSLPPAEASDEEVLENVRQFIGSVTTLSGLPQVINMITEITSLGSIDKLGDSVQNIYYNLGLGFITWQMTSPLIDNAIGQSLKRYAARKYRPERFDLNQIQELTAIGLMSSTELRSYLQELGWRDRDIDYVITLSYKQLSYSQVMSMWAKGILSESDVISELRRMGYTPTDIQKIVQLERPEADENTPKLYLSTLDSAYKKHYINEAQYRSYAAELHLDNREVDLRIAILNTQEEEATRDLTVGNIKDAFISNIVSEAEAVHYLSDLNLSIDNVNLLLNTWKEQKAPKVQQVNRTTVTAAYSAGVINRSRARELLESIGLSSEAVTLTLDTIDAQNTVLEKTPAISALIQALQRGIISRDDFAQAMREQGYPESTIAIYVQLALYQPVAKTKGLTKSEILEAYAKGIVDRTTALVYLQGLGYDIPSSELLLTMEAKSEVGTTELQLTKSAILTATYYDTITPEQATDLLAKLDYGYDGANYLVSLTEANQAKHITTPGMGAVIGALRQGLLDFDTFSEVLAKNGLDEIKIAKVYAIAMYNPPKNTNRLTKADALNMYNKKIWSKAETLAYLIQLGYEGEDADYILATYTGEQVS